MELKSNKREERKNRKKIKILRKNYLLSNVNRIVNSALILNLGVSYLSLSNSFLLLMILMLSNVTTYLNMRVILSVVMCINAYVLSVSGGFLFNNIYNKIKLKKFSSKKEVELLEEELLNKINLDKLIVRNRIEVIKKECDDTLRNSKIDTSLDCDMEKLNGLYHELDYLIIKKNLLENYLEFDDATVFDKIKKKLIILNDFMFAPFCSLIFSSIGGIPLFTSICIGALGSVIMDIINDQYVFPKLINVTRDRVETVTMNVQNRLGDFYIAKDCDSLVIELANNYDQITAKVSEIISYYSTLYKTKIMDSCSNKINSKSIVPIDRTYDPISVSNSRVLKKD